MHPDHSTCPNCEYELGQPGKPVRNGHELHCMQCGHSWKEYGDLASQGPARVPVWPAEQLPAKRPTMTTAPTSSHAGEPGIGTAMAIAVAAVAFMAFVVGGTVFGLDRLANSGNEHVVKVEQVSFEELVRGSGGKVVRVSGSIRNTGSQAVAMPGVSIVLRSANGSEIARWKHASSRKKLKPGETTHFTTAKPVQASVVASADANLELATR